MWHFDEARRVHAMRHDLATWRQVLRPVREKPIHGGVVSVVKDVNYELVAKADSIALYVTDHGKAIELTGGTAKLTILSGSERSDVPLTPAGERFEAKGNFKLGAGAKVAAQVSLPGKTAVAVRFTLK